MSSSIIKNDYKTKYTKSRSRNLIYLREEIAKLSLTDFSKKLKIPKGNLSFMESGERTPSISNIHSYKEYFLINHNIDVSCDFILGYSNSMTIENPIYPKTLTPKSISTIENLDNESIIVLNKALCHKSIKEFLLSLSYFYKISEK